MRCPKCNSENIANAKFCRECGSTLEAIKQVAVGNFVECPKCGNSIESSKNFCPKCGTSKAEAEEIEQQRIEAAEEQERHAEARRQRMQVWRNRLWGNARRRLVTGVVIALMLCGLGGGVLLSYYLIKQHQMRIEAETMADIERYYWNRVTLQVPPNGKSNSIFILPECRWVLTGKDFSVGIMDESDHTNIISKYWRVNGDFKSWDLSKRFWKTAPLVWLVDVSGKANSVTYKSDCALGQWRPGNPTLQQRISKFDNSSQQPAGMAAAPSSSEIGTVQQALEQGHQQHQMDDSNSPYRQLTKMRAEKLHAYIVAFGTNREKAALHDLVVVLDQMVTNREQAAELGDKAAATQLTQCRAEAAKYRR